MATFPESHEEEEWGDEEEWEEVLVKAALSLSKRISDDEFEPLANDLHDVDCPRQQASLAEEFWQLASAFTQLLQVGQQQETGMGGDCEEEEEEEDDDDDTVDTAETVETMEIEEDSSEALNLKGDIGGGVAASYVPNAMHYAVFRCDVNAIVALLDEENIKNPQGYTYDAQDSQDLHPFRHSLDTPDHCGNTPLLLAVKLGYVQLAKLLIAEGFQCDITSKLHVALAYSETSTSELSASASPLLIQEGPEFHLLDECVLLRSIPLIKAVYQQLQRNTYTLWLEKRKKVLQTLLKIPDFYVELNWEFMGAGLMGPVVKMFAPYDTYRIWKKGNWLRLDSTIEQIHLPNLRVGRAHTSLIFQGSNSASCPAAMGEGELYLLNRKERTYERMMRRFADPSDAELNHFANQMLAAHSANKGVTKTKGGGKNSSSGDQHMSVNSVDVDANNWVLRALTDRRGSPKSVRLACEQSRDVYADLAESSSEGSRRNCGSRTGEASTTAAAISTNGRVPPPVAASRLCYKWEASGHVRASVAIKTSQEAQAFRQRVCEEAYFSAAPALSSATSMSSAQDDRPSSSSRSKWSSRLEGRKKAKKDRNTAPKAKEITKKVDAAIYMVKDYPIALSELLPVLDIFAMKNEYLKKLVDIFNGNGRSDKNAGRHKAAERTTYSCTQVDTCDLDGTSSSTVGSNGSAPASFLNVPAELFPYRIQVPIILGISAMATFENFQRSPDIDPALFSIDVGAYTELVDIHIPKSK